MTLAGQAAGKSNNESDKMKSDSTPSKIGFFRLLGYAFGEGAVSISMNGVNNFAMLFFTQVLGLSAAYAGMALSITLLWDAVTDPVMGHITDNTRSRFGRRFPYLFAGGVALAVTFFLLWAFPLRLSSPVLIFWAVLVLNLLMRTALTVFVVPYAALGFEICPEYVDRARLQGVRYFLNQMVNLVFGAFAWSMFFKDSISETGERVDGTLIASNYLMMAAVLSVGILLLVGICIAVTRRYAKDSRSMRMEGTGLKDFFNDIAAIFRDRLAWFVFAFFAVSNLAMVLVGMMQMFTYVHFMQFNAGEKTFVHGVGMVAFALGSLGLNRLVRRFDKKPAGYIGIAVSMAGGLALFAVFSGGLVDPGLTWTAAGCQIPLAVLIFALFQGMWWGGCGVLVPLATSMIADVSAINAHRTGLLKDGSYSAVFSFFLKASSAVGLLLTGWMISGAGIVAGGDVQTAEAAGNVALLTFLSGPLVALLSFFILKKYPINGAFMKKLEESPERPEQTKVLND
jgi:glycoside/pentoside/hexuronide:cation symporter, GPH family